MKWAFALILTFTLSGCASMLHSHVSTFHELQPYTSKTYTMRPFKDQQGSLEYKTYASIIKRNLDARGFREVPFEEAELAVLFSYGIDSGKEIVSSYPIIGQTGSAGSYTTGTITSYGNMANYSGTTSSIPRYGVVGSGVARRTEYMRFLKLEMVDAAQHRKDGTIHLVYEAKVDSAGSTAQLAAVLPLMVKSLFEDFPGKSGSVRKSTVQMTDD